MYSVRAWPACLSLRGACAVSFNPRAHVPCPWILLPFRDLIHAEPSLVPSGRNVPGPGVSRFVDLLAYRRASRRPVFVFQRRMDLVCGSLRILLFFTLHNIPCFSFLSMHVLRLSCVVSMDCLSPVYPVQGVPLAATFALVHTLVAPTVVRVITCWPPLCCHPLAPSLRGALIARSIARWRGDSLSCASIYSARNLATLCSNLLARTFNQRQRLSPLCSSSVPVSRPSNTHTHTHSAHPTILPSTQSFPTAVFRSLRNLPVSVYSGILSSAVSCSKSAHLLCKCLSACLSSLPCLLSLSLSLSQSIVAYQYSSLSEGQTTFSSAHSPHACICFFAPCTHAHLCRTHPVRALAPSSHATPRGRVSGLSPAGPGLPGGVFADSASSSTPTNTRPSSCSPDIYDQPKLPALISFSPSRPMTCFPPARPPNSCALAYQSVPCCARRLCSALSILSVLSSAFIFFLRFSLLLACFTATSHTSA